MPFSFIIYYFNFTTNCNSIYMQFLFLNFYQLFHHIACSFFDATLAQHLRHCCSRKYSHSSINLTVLI